MFQARMSTFALALAACVPEPAGERAPLTSADSRSASVDVCHVDQYSGDWHLITIAERAVETHLDMHGDWMPAEEEICGNLFDDDCDGMIDGGCTGCDVLVTRGPDWWVDLDCALVDGVGIDPFPMGIGSSFTFASGADALEFLAADVGGDPELRLRRQLLALKLNIAFFGVGDKEAVDTNGDGYLETYDQLAAWAAFYYDYPPWPDFRAYVANVLRGPNSAGEELPTWLDDECMHAMACGYEDDDQGCGCVEVCDELDNDYDGEVDEDCG